MKEKHSLFTSEAVSEGHPDKVADQISDAILDAFIAKDQTSRVACETLVTTGQVIVAGEISSSAKVDVSAVVRDTIKRIGYDKPEYKFDGESCGIINLLHEQSADIRRGVEREDIKNQGAGDQGMMFGYATDETESYMPLPIFLANLFVKELAAIRREGKAMPYLRPDAKSQVTVEYDEEGTAVHIDTIVISAQHDEFILPDEVKTQDDADAEMHDIITYDIKNYVLQRVKERINSDVILGLFDENTRILVNPTGKFVIGGPHGDTGLTGRKIIADTYGGRGAHGGGAFSGKDPSKVDRSAAYMARYIAKNMVAAGVAKEMLVQLSYAIGVAEPVSVNVQTYGTGQTYLTDAEIAIAIKNLFDLRPRAIEERLSLRQPMYLETAAYGHVGRESTNINKTIEGVQYGVGLFTWEALDAVDEISKHINNR
ncbi:MAG: methionine adenosyltransferase [Bacteroidaceae bacterium]|nr:methionine adenosyltransferase [Bacteroidaceae bacterium]